MRYFYLVASLPPAALGDEPAWTPEDFLFHCQGALAHDDWVELSLIVEDRLDEATSAFAAWWHALDTQIRSTQARIRAARLNTDPRPYLRLHSGYDVRASRAVTDAMSRANPLEREMALDRTRWVALDERILGEPFGFDGVLAYAVRLRLMQRWTRMSDDDGLDRIEQFITENVDESIELQRLGGA